MPPALLAPTWSVPVVALMLAVPARPGRSEDKTAPAPTTPAAPDPALGRQALSILKTESTGADPEARLEAARAWGELGNPAAAGVLRRMLRDGNLYVRLEAAYSIALLGDPAGLKAITSTVNTSTAPVKTAGPADEIKSVAEDKVRAAAVAKLGRLPDVRAVEILEKAIEDRSAAVRDAAAVALCRQGFPEFAEGFLLALRSPDDGIRAEAARSLAESGLAVGLDELREAAADAAPGVRAQALRALGNFSDPFVLEVLARGRRDVNRTIRVIAVDSIGRIAGTRASQLLREAAADKEHPSLALKAAAHLGRRGEEVDLALAEGALKTGDRDLELEAVEILKSAKADRVAELLKAAMHPARDPRVRVRAAAALVRRMAAPGARP